MVNQARSRCAYPVRVRQAGDKKPFLTTKRRLPGRRFVASQQPRPPRSVPREWSGVPEPLMRRLRARPERGPNHDPGDPIPPSSIDHVPQLRFDPLASNYKIRNRAPPIRRLLEDSRFGNMLTNHRRDVLGHDVPGGSFAAHEGHSIKIR